jgi:hypothetical protein
MHIPTFRVLFWRYEGLFVYAYIYLFRTNQHTYPPSGFYSGATTAALPKVVLLYAYIYPFRTNQRIYSLSGFYSGATIKPSSKETRSTTHHDPTSSHHPSKSTALVTVWTRLLILPCRILTMTSISTDPSVWMAGREVELSSCACVLV